MEYQKKKTKIYMVEDNATFALVTATSIEVKLNCNVIFFNSGEDLLKNLWRKPDIIILDLNLGTEKGIFNGQEVLEIVKSVQPLIQVIILTSSTKLKTSLELIKGGAVDFIQKNDQYFTNLLKSVETIINMKNINTDSLMVKKQTEKLIKRIALALVIFATIFGTFMLS